MPPLPPLEVDAARLQAELDRLAGFSDTPAPSVTRILFTDTDMAGRAYVKDLMEDAGLQIREDAAGNIFGRWVGAGEGAVGSGSHCDAIPHAGRLDGTLGVLGGIAAVRALREAGFSPDKNIDIIMFTSEEPTRFGLGCSGSRLLGGAIAPEELDGLKDDEGISFAQARQQAGYSGDLAGVEMSPETYSHFVELHIEQGPVLEAQQVQIGVVSAIAAPASFRISFSGAGGHAGTVLMPDRRDALVPAAQLITLAEELARASHSDDTVATVGMVEVHPGAINSIPREVTVSFDIRDTALEVREGVVQIILQRAESLAAERGLTCSVEMINSDPPAHAAPDIQQAIETASDAAGLSRMSMVSRAYHDSLFMARKVPMGMIFVPSKDGISHRPDEYTSPQEMAQGVQVLAGTLAALAGSARG